MLQYLEGGNHAVDAARTAQHLLGANGVTSLVCQYTINDIKADKEEVAAMIEEGVNIVEWFSYSDNKRRQPC